jgi:hypothetical protein
VDEISSNTFGMGEPVLDDDDIAAGTGTQDDNKATTCDHESEGQDSGDDRIEDIDSHDDEEIVKETKSVDSKAQSQDLDETHSNEKDSEECKMKEVASDTESGEEDIEEVMVIL